MKSVDPEIMRRWESLAEKGQAHISVIQEGIQVECLALCHATNPEDDGNPLDNVEDCTAIERQAVHAVAIKSHSIIPRTIQFHGKSDPPSIHFNVRPDEPSEFDHQCLIPNKTQNEPPVCGEICVPLMPCDDTPERPVRIITGVQIIRGIDNNELDTKFSIELVPRRR